MKPDTIYFIGRCVVAAIILFFIIRRFWIWEIEKIEDKYITIITKQGKRRISSIPDEKFNNMR